MIPKNMHRMRLALAGLTLLASLSTASNRPYSPPRLYDGHVDLQGTWLLANVTQLERPPQFKTLVIDAGEAASIGASRIARLEDRKVISTGSEFYDDIQVTPIRGELHSSIIIDPADGLIPGTALFHEKRAERRAALLSAFDGPEQRPASERCLQQFDGPAPILINANRSFRQIVQTPDTIVVAGESIHDARIIRLNAKHAPAAVVSWLGDSIGWWEGDTLVVETRYFTTSSQARASGPNVYFVSPETTVVERFTRVANEALHYRFTVSDPAYYTQPWTGENEFVRSTERLYEYACHEGNYSLGHALRGARAQEAKSGKAGEAGQKDDSHRIISP